MLRNYKIESRKVIKKLGKLLFCLSLSFLFFSCFTGIEGTKKINLSHEDRKNLQPTPEEKLMAVITPSYLKDWEEGKKFIASDNRAIIAIVPRQGLSPVYPDSIKGKELVYTGVESKMNPAGEITLSIIFTDGIYIYAYDTGKEFKTALDEVQSDKIPMLIDEDMVAQAGSLLKGKSFWSRTNLWYDSLDNRVEGRKYVEVTVEEVMPGNMVFPLKLKIQTQKGDEAFVYMNFGNADNESRAFHNLFSLSDLRKQYSGIDSKTWDLISQGKIKEGMTKEEVKLAIGNPTDLNSGHDYSQTLDVWIYENGRALWFEDGRLVKIRQ